MPSIRRSTAAAAALVALLAGTVTACGPDGDQALGGAAADQKGQADGGSSSPRACRPAWTI